MENRRDWNKVGAIAQIVGCVIAVAGILVMVWLGVSAQENIPIRPIVFHLATWIAALLYFAGAVWAVRMHWKAAQMSAFAVHPNPQTPSPAPATTPPPIVTVAPPHTRFLRLEKCGREDSDDGLYPAEPPYLDRVALVLINQRDVEIEVGMPVWESEGVYAKIPLPPSLQLEGPYGRRENDWVSHWERCLVIQSQQAFKVTVDFRIPFGDGMDIRLKRETTGTLVFPLRIQDKLVQERISI
jgi:hypothetical protein